MSSVSSIYCEIKIGNKGNLFHSINNAGVAYFIYNKVYLIESTCFVKLINIKHHTFNKMESSNNQVTTNLTQRTKYLITLACYLAFFSYGLSNTVILSTLLDISENVNSSFKNASFGLVIGALTHSISFLFCKFD